MEQLLYSIYDNNGRIAQGMDLEVALVLVEGLMEKYYKDEDLSFTIKREYCEINCNIPVKNNGCGWVD